MNTTDKSATRTTDIHDTLGSTASYLPTTTSKVLDKQNMKSDVWGHFEKILNESTRKAENVKCIHCKIVYKYNSNWGTSTMWKHINSCRKFPQNMDKRQKIFASSKAEGATGSGVLSTWVFDQDHCRKMLARMIIVDEQPFSMVEHEGFRAFVNAVQPAFKHVSRFTVARDCMKIYLSERIMLKDFICSLKSRVALTTDTWTSNQNLNYLCLTAHFIDHDWKLHKRILNFVVTSSHKGKEIGRMVEKCIYDWGIQGRISTLTVDNASSNDVAVKYLKEKLIENNSLILRGEFFHMRCIAHILNLIVKDGLVDAYESISRVRKMIRYVRSSSSRFELFNKCVMKERISHKGSVCLDVSTRWNSTYLMLDTALKFKKAFERLEEDDLAMTFELQYDLPNSEDWSNVEVLLKFLKKFYDATKKLSGSLYVTANSYFQEVVSIFTVLNDWAKSANDIRLQSMSNRMREKFDKYFGSIEKCNMMVLIAVVLDPRYKLNFVMFCCKKVYGDDFATISLIVERLKLILHRLFEDYERASGSDGLQIDALTSDKNVEHPGSCSEASTFNDYDMYGNLHDDYVRYMEEELMAGNKSELERYLEEKCVECKTDFEVLNWWKIHSSKYKILSCMTRDILAIPVSTVASESAFSTSGRVLDCYRSSLTPTVVELLICVQDWLRSPLTPVSIEESIENLEKYEQDFTNITSENTEV